MSESSRELAAIGRAENIRTHVTQLNDLITVAWRERDDLTLGYESWSGYCIAQFGRGELAVKARRVIVALLQGTEREIAEILGVSQPTVHRDLTAAEEAGPFDSPSNQIQTENQAEIPPPMAPARTPRGRRGGRRQAWPPRRFSPESRAAASLSGEQLQRNWKTDIDFTVSVFADAPDEVLSEMIAKLYAGGTTAD
jgi:DNA-binding CsgD family transcriptional regulator